MPGGEGVAGAGFEVVLEMIGARGIGEGGVGYEAPGGVRGGVGEFAAVVILQAALYI